MLDLGDGLPDSPGSLDDFMDSVYRLGYCMTWIQMAFVDRRCGDECDCKVYVVASAECLSIIHACLS